MSLLESDHAQNHPFNNWIRRRVPSLDIPALNLDLQIPNIIRRAPCSCVQIAGRTVREMTVSCWLFIVILALGFTRACPRKYSRRVRQSRAERFCEDGCALPKALGPSWARNRLANAGVLSWRQRRIRSRRKAAVGRKLTSCWSPKDSAHADVTDRLRGTLVVVVHHVGQPSHLSSQTTWCGQRGAPPPWPYSVNVIDQSVAGHGSCCLCRCCALADRRSIGGLRDQSHILVASR